MEGRFLKRRGGEDGFRADAAGERCLLSAGFCIFFHSNVYVYSMRKIHREGRGEEDDKPL